MSYRVMVTVTAGGVAEIVLVVVATVTVLVMGVI